MKIVVDTSVWIDFFNGQVNEQTTKLKQLIKDDEEIVLIPVIIQEILQGIRQENQFKLVISLLKGFPVLKGKQWQTQ
jgi:predicted nucleic acid-binding protein